MQAQLELDRFFLISSLPFVPLLTSIQQVCGWISRLINRILLLARKLIWTEGLEFDFS